MACVIETAMPCALLASFAQALLERGHEVCKLAGQFAAETQSPASAAARAPRAATQPPLPSLHDPPPAPSKHLTRCLRNRVQARSCRDAPIVAAPCPPDSPKW